MKKTDIIKNGLISWLFIPINENRFINNIPELQADCFVLDLEDSVLKCQKDDARRLLGKERIQEFKNIYNIFVRINHFDTRWGKQDVIFAINNGFYDIIIPKICKPEDISEIENYLKANISSEEFSKVNFIPIIENISGYRNFENILKNSSKIDTVIFGSEDFLADLSMIRRKSSGIHALLFKVLIDLSIIAHKYNIRLIDCASPYFYQSDLQQFEKECEVSASFGLSGKLAIHPNQISIINKVFNTYLVDDLSGFFDMIKQVLIRIKNSKKASVVFQNRLYSIPELRKAYNIICTMENNQNIRKELIELKEEIKKYI